MSDINEVLEQAEKTAAELTKPTTFNLAERLSGRGFPTDTVKVYLNEGAAYQLVSLMNQEAPTDQDALEAFNNVVQQVTKEVLESELTFELRGISTGHSNQIKKNVKKEHPDLADDSEEFTKILTNHYIAPHIVRIKDAGGGVDEHLYTPDEVADLYDLLPISEWLKLSDAVGKLSFTTGYFENATDAGFLPKS